MSNKVKNMQNKKNITKASPSKGKAAATAYNKGFNYYLLPFIFVIAVIPLVVFLKIYDPKLQQYGFFSNEQISSDIFLYWKGVLLVICAVIMALMMAWGCYKKKLEISLKKIFIPLAGYMLLTLLSSFFSDTPEFAFFGSYEQFESCLVILGYGITTYYASLVITTDKDLEVITKALTISTIIMLLLGVGQAFSADFFRTPFFFKFASLGIPSHMRADEGSLEFAFENGRVYLTLYNPNYVGSYVALLAPIFLTLAIAKKKLSLIALNMVIFVGLLLTVLGSGSRAGFIGIAVSLVLLLFIFNKRLKKYWMEAIIVLVLLVGTFYTMNNYSNNGIVNRLKSALSFENQEYALKDITMDGNSVSITHNNATLLASYGQDTEGHYYFTLGDDKGNPVYAEPDENGWYIPESDEFRGIKVGYAAVADYPGLIISIDGKNWGFAYVEDELYYYNYLGKLTKIKHSETFEPLSRISKFASGRGYIWSKTLPLLKDNILLGSGPDTFLLQYPNEDYLDQYNHGYGSEIMTKPHNQYLQIGVQTGVLSLICFLVFYFWYFAVTIRTLRRSDKSKPKALIAIGILCGTFGYMVVGLINDSTVTVAPLYWAMLGVGIALNFMLKKELPLNEAAPEDAKAAKAEVKKEDSASSHTAK